AASGSLLLEWLHVEGADRLLVEQAALRRVASAPMRHTRRDEEVRASAHSNITLLGAVQIGSRHDHQGDIVRMLVQRVLRAWRKASIRGVAAATRIAPQDRPRGPFHYVAE